MTDVHIALTLYLQEHLQQSRSRVDHNGIIIPVNHLALKLVFVDETVVDVRLHHRKNDGQWYSIKLLWIAIIDSVDLANPDSFDRILNLIAGTEYYTHPSYHKKRSRVIPKIRKIRQYERPQESCS